MTWSRRQGRRDVFLRASNYCDLGGAGGVDGVDAGGDSGCVNVAPEPVVLGGGVVRGAVLLLVVVDEEPLLAVVLLLFQPATIKNRSWRRERLIHSSRR